MDIIDLLNSYQIRKSMDTQKIKKLPDSWKNLLEEVVNEEKSAKQELTSTANIVSVDFGSPLIEYPKAMAAASSSHEVWYSKGYLQVKIEDGSEITIYLQKESDTPSITVKVDLQSTELPQLEKIKGKDVVFSLMDGETELARLFGKAKENAKIILAEGYVETDILPENGSNVIALYIWNHD